MRNSKVIYFNLIFYKFSEGTSFWYLNLATWNVKLDK